MKALSNLTINEPEKENMLTDQPTTEEVFIINSIDFTNAKQSELESWIENKSIQSRETYKSTMHFLEMGMLNKTN